LGDPTAMGQRQSVTKPTPVTEVEAEFAVTLCKHVFAAFLVLEFRVTNTLQGVALSQVNVTVDVNTVTPGASEPASAKFRFVGAVGGLAGAEPTDDGIPAVPPLGCGQSESCFVVLSKLDPNFNCGASCGSFGAKLGFHQLEDGDDLGFPDETPLEIGQVTPGDYLTPAVDAPPLDRAKGLWEQFKGQGCEAVSRLQLDFRSLELAVAGVLQAMNMAPADGCSTKPTPGRNAHELWLCGTFAGGVGVVCKALIGVNPQGRVLMQLSVAASNREVAEAIAGTVMQ